MKKILTSRNLFSTAYGKKRKTQLRKRCIACLIAIFTVLALILPLQSVAIAEALSPSEQSLSEINVTPGDLAYEQQPKATSNLSLSDLPESIVIGDYDGISTAVGNASIEQIEEGTHLSGPTVTPGGNSITVKGKFLYYYMPKVMGVKTPVKHARVELYTWNTGPFGPAWFGPLASGWTEADGSYEFTIPYDSSFAEVYGYHPFVWVYAKNWAAKVMDNPAWIPDILPGNDGEVYGFIAGPVFNVPDHSIVDIGEVVAPEATHGAYNILNTVTEGWYFLERTTGLHAPRVTVFWRDWFTPGSSYYMPWSVADRYSISGIIPGAWEWLFFITNPYLLLADVGLEEALESIRGIHIQDGHHHQWEEDVILHEYGHYLMDKYADFWPPDTKLDHTYTGAYNRRHAWGEGWAHFFSAAARRGSGYSVADYTGNPPIEYNYAGDNVEAAVAGVLWDMHDPWNGAEPNDTLELGFKEIWDILLAYDPGPDSGWPDGKDHAWHIYDFFWGCCAEHPSIVSGLWRICSLHGIDAQTQDDTPPTNPTWWSSTHTPGEPSWGGRIRIWWSGAYDDLSGVAGYSILWDNSSSTLPPETINFPGGGGDIVDATTSPPLARMRDWYFHIRTVDYAGNWAPHALHVGPFITKTEFPDDDTTGPDFLHPSSYFTQISPLFDKTPPQEVFRIQIDPRDRSGIYDVQFRASPDGLEWTEWQSHTGSSGYTYWYDFTPDIWVPLSGATIYWQVYAEDNDNEGWEDRTGSTSSVYSATILKTYAVDVSINPLTETVEPSSSITYAVSIENTGNVEDTYDLTLQGLDVGWYSFSQTSITVGVTQTEQVALTMSPPADAELQDYPFTVTATSQTDPSVLDTANAVVTVAAPVLHVTAESPVNIRVTDPTGLHVGYDPETGPINQIPGAKYSGPGTEPQEIMIPNPAMGTYMIDAFGTDTGTYTITLESFALDGSLIDSQVWAGTAEPGEQYTQNVQLEADGDIADITPPTTEISLVGTSGLNGWYTSDVTVTLTPTDDMSGVAITKYRLDCTSWTTYTGPFVIDTEGTTIIYYNSTDNAGNIELTSTVTIILDKTPPTTTLTIGEPKYVSGKTYVTPDTPFTLEAADAGSGVYSTAYRIHNATVDSGWQTYTAPFKLTSLTDGTYTIEYNSTDNAGNIEPTHTVSVTLDNSGPAIVVENPPPGWALQDGVTFIASASDSSGTQSLSFSIREANGEEGIPVGFEDIPATFDATTGKWELLFDTLQLPDGFYVVLVSAEDNLGHTVSITVPYSIRNWAVLELLPASKNNKAGRTMPIKFALRVAASVDPTQPFVYNEELTIEIYATENPSNILQTSTFGDTARDYRINILSEHYITNFKTLKSPMEYTVAIYRNTFDVGSFTFETVK